MPDRCRYIVVVNGGILALYDTEAEAQACAEKAAGEVVRIPRRCGDCASFYGGFRCWVWDMEKKATDEACNQGRMA